MSAHCLNARMALHVSSQAARLPHSLSMVCSTLSPRTPSFASAPQGIQGLSVIWTLTSECPIHRDIVASYDLTCVPPADVQAGPASIMQCAMALSSSSSSANAFLAIVAMRANRIRTSVPPTRAQMAVRVRNLGLLTHTCVRACWALPGLNVSTISMNAPGLPLCA